MFFIIKPKNRPFLAWRNTLYNKNKIENAYTDIGDEYDLILKYKASENLKLLAIGTYLNAGDFITENDIAQNNASKVFLQFMYKFSTN